MSPRNPWPLLVLLLVAGFLALSGWSFYRAATGASAVTDRDYYSHGLRFNQTLLERQAAASLGWEVEASLAGHLLQVALLDRDRRPVAAASGSLLLQPAFRGEPVRLALTEHNGLYQCRLPAGSHGEIPVQIDFEHQGTRLSRRLLLVLP